MKLKLRNSKHFHKRSFSYRFYHNWSQNVEAPSMIWILNLLRFLCFYARLSFLLFAGPVGQNGRLQSGDELLEVNGRKLLGLYHTDVVGILKDLPMHVRLVCARLKNADKSKLDLSERMVKAKSDGSISSSGTTTETSQSKLKSRSLEPLSSLAMWSEEVLVIGKL